MIAKDGCEIFLMRYLSEIEQKNFFDTKRPPKSEASEVSFDKSKCSKVN